MKGRKNTALRARRSYHSAQMGEPLSIEYDGGDSLKSDVKKWLKTNGIKSPFH